MRTFYGLDGSEPVVAPRYLPSGAAPKGASEFEKSMRKRLNALTRDDNNAKAGPEEAAALREAGLPLLERGDKWIIDKTKAGKETDVSAAARNDLRAADVRQFYGLDGSPPIVAPGYLPSVRAPQGASEFEKSMRRRLYDLTQEDSRYRAGPEEAAALREAGLPLLERGDKSIIDKTKAGKETDVSAAVRDDLRAADVRQFYGLDGSPPIVAPRYLPSAYAPRGASEFEKSTRKRLNNLAQEGSHHRAGRLEAAALRAAGLPLLEREGKWIIDKNNAVRALARKAVSSDHSIPGTQEWQGA
ncbi:hypothetical protein, partial [Streptomyces sp. C1-2]|uniref:hypothetical protein n=1 Tax=Streptomyces sp. C1-2 TaxID=2720022 RepID=UPI0014324EDF